MAHVVRTLTAEPEWPGEWERRTRTRRSGASGCTRISTARGDGDQSRVRRRHLADDAMRRRSAFGNGSARPIRGLASTADRRWAATFSLLLALGSNFDGELPNQREG